MLHPTGNLAPGFALLGGCMLVALAYWVGMRGPLLLDDFGNLADVNAWLSGERTWQSAVLNNRSGIGGRPLSMASFVLDAALWGRDVWHYKLTNLLLHLGCGLALYVLYRRLAIRDPDLSRDAPWVAAFLAVLWLALPIQASSVLYVVQRMAILAALFSLVALWVFVIARERLERSQAHGATLLLLLVPAFAALAFLSKENGALVPLMALALELAYFRSPAWRDRPRAVHLFFGAFLALPASVAVFGYALRPERLLNGYALRDFTMAERLLSQPRILWDYVNSILVPYTPKLGIFHDNYLKSTSLVAPWTTLPAIVGWILLLVIAWRNRARHPAILCGLLFYLAGHAMESSVFSLELYFEHRNYLPSVGLLWAIAGLAVAIYARLPAPTPLFRRALSIAPVAVFAVFLMATHGRARVWSGLDSFYAQELLQNPDSPRLRSYLAGEAISQGDTVGALRHIAVAEANDDPSQRMTATLWKILAHCSSSSVPDALYDEASTRARGTIMTFAMVGWENLSQRVERGACEAVDPAKLIDIGKAWLEQASDTQARQGHWRTRYNLARLLASQSRLEEAAAEAEEAWRASKYNNGIGVFLFQINASLGRREKCEEILYRLQSAHGGDLKLNQAIAAFTQALKNDEI